MKKIKIILEMIRFEHTIFVLPFAYLGTILGSINVNHHLPSWMQIAWITLAMVGARSAAMGLNRVIDRHIDGRNPRTQDRAIPSGKITVSSAWVLIMFSFLLLFFAASKLDPLALKLSPIAVFFLSFYSYTKRFTWTSHLFLGIATALGPLGGWIAVTGEVLSPVAILLFVTVASWIGGFDILYACQDVEFDKKEGLHSIPVRFGIARALIISSLLHTITALGLIAVWFVAHLGWWFAFGVVCALGMLIYEHAILSKNDLSRLNTAFFTANGVIGIVVFIFALMDVLLSGTHG